MNTPDIEISGSGFYSIAGVTPTGRSFLRRHVDGAKDGSVFCDSTPYTQDIADGAIARGLHVSVNGRPYGGAQS